MKLDLVLAVSAAAFALALLSSVAQWRFSVSNRRDLEQLRAELERQMNVSAETHSELNRGLAALGQTVRNAPKMPRSGVLNRSARTQALQLLRSGLAPDTVASSLELGKREMRLLERVAHTLFQR